MDNFTLHCTEEQTKKALELGAPIEYANIVDIRAKRFVNSDTGVYKIPTAEEMIGWLRSKGFRFSIEELSATIVAYRASYGYWYKCGQSSNPKGATFNVIDAALEYLSLKVKYHF